MANEWWNPLAGQQQAGTSPEKNGAWWDSLAKNNAKPATPLELETDWSLGPGRFLAEATLALGDMASKAQAQFYDFVARNPSVIAKVAEATPLNPLVTAIRNTKDLPIFEGNLAKSWQTMIEGTAGVASQKALTLVEAQKPKVQPTQEYQNSTLEQKLTTYLPETLFHLGANITGSFAAFAAGGAIGTGIVALSTAHDIKGYARESGMDEGTSDVLALGAGAVIGLLDKAGFERVFGKEVYSTFARSFASRIFKGAASEGVTEVAQENVQLIAEAIVRDDLTISEVKEREVMAFLGGILGGGVGKALSSSVNDVLERVNETANKPRAQQYSGQTQAEFNARLDELNRKANGDESTGTTGQALTVEEAAAQKQLTEAVAAPTRESLMGGSFPQNSTTATKKAPTVSVARAFATPPADTKGSLMEQMRGRTKLQLSIDTQTAEALNIGQPGSPKIGSAYELNGQLFVVRDIDADGIAIGYVVPLDGSPTVSLETAKIEALLPIKTDIASLKQAMQTAKAPTGERRSEQFVSNETAKKTIRRYFTAEELSLIFVDRINTPDGGEAFGRYTPHMIELINNPHKTTADHEAVHAYLDLFYEDGEKQAVFDAARKQAGADLSNYEVEEWLADRFARFVQSRTGVTGVIRDFFERVLNFLRNALRRNNPDVVEKLFDDIRFRNRPATPKVQSDVRREYYQEPEKLTSKIFTFPELADRMTVSRQFLSDFMKSGKANLKQAERLLLEDVLNTQFKPESDPLLDEARKYKSAEEFVTAQINAYHGTPNKEFAEFKLGMSNNSENETNGLGVWVTPQEGAAKLFSNKIEGAFFGGKANLKDVGGTVMQVSVQLKNPRIYTPTKGGEEILEEIERLEKEKPSVLSYSPSWESDNEKAAMKRKKYDEIVAKVKKLKKDYRRDSFENFMDDRDQFVEYISKGAKWEERYVSMNTKEANKKFIEYLKAQGHDGIVIKETEFDADGSGHEVIDQIAVFDPKQVLTKTQLTDIYNQSQAQKQAPDKIDVQAFKKAVEAELLPLDITDGHSDLTRQYGPRYEGIALPAETRGGIESYNEHVYESPIKTSAGKVHFGLNAENYFAHARIEDMTDGTTRRVIEVQSDLFQKGRLDQEGKQAREILDQDAASDNSDVAAFVRAQATERLQGVSKLEQYSQTWWQRVIREEIRDAAMAGKKVLRFPTGETAMKIEGLGSGNFWRTEDGRPVDANTRIQVGQVMNQGEGDFEMGQDWVVTDVLGGGRFKAVQMDQLTSEDLDYTKENPTRLRQLEETFDISGEVDTKSPIYRYYERDVVPYLLKWRRGNARLMTDGNGVSWVETALTQEDRGPVIAYQKAEGVPDADYRVYVEQGTVASPDANLAAQETIAAFEIERELGFIPGPGEMPIGLAADLDYRRNLALEALQQAELQEDAEKEQAAFMLAEGLIFPDSEMEEAYGRFKKEAKRRKWMLDPSTDEMTIKTKLEGAGAYKNPRSIDTAFFPTLEGEGMSNNDALDQYKNRYIVEEELVDVLKKKTASEIRAKAKSMAERVVRSATVKKAISVKTKVLNINRRPKTEITADEMKLLKDRLSAMARGSKEGFVAGKKFTKDEMLKKYRQRDADRLALVDNLTWYLTQNLPAQQRGRFVKAIAKLNNPQNAKAAFDIMDQVDRVQENYEKREAITDFKEQVTKFKKGAPSIALDYQERIKEILSSFQASKPTEATLRRLNAMAAFMEKNPGAYIPTGVVSQLKRLARKPLAEMTAAEITEVNDMVAELVRLGKLKQDLKNVYNEREWAKTIAELELGTVNRDPEEGKLRRAKDAAIKFSDEINTPARVFDDMDGAVSYAGPNVKLYRTIRAASQQAEIVADAISLDLMEKIQALGVDTLTEEQQLVLSLHSAMDQGNTTSVGYTMEKHGIGTLRPLTEQEQGILDLARQAVGQQTDDFAATFEEKNNQRFVRVENNYLPFRYADDNPTSAVEFVLDERMMKRSVEPGSVIERAPEVKRELRADFLNVVLQAIESQSNYIYLEPAMMNAAAIVKTKEYREFSGTHNSLYWAEYLDAVARNGSSANALTMRYIDPFVKGVRFNVSAAILGGRASTVLLQPFTLFHTHAIMAMRYGPGTVTTLMSEITKTFFKPGYSKEVVAESPALTLREGGDATIRELSGKVGAATSDNPAVKARNKLIEASLLLMKKADILTASSSNQAFYRILRAEGMSDAEARAEADFLTDLVAASSQVADRALVFSRGEGARMFTTFMTFAFNEWGIVSHDLVKTGLIKGDHSAKLRATYALGIIFASKMLEQVMRDALRDLLRKEEKKQPLPSVESMTASSIVSVVPFFGPLVSSSIRGFSGGQLVDSPVLSVIEDVISGTNSALQGKQAATREKGALKVVKGFSTLTGVPFVPLIIDWMRNNLID